MPNVLLVRGWRFFFYSNEGNEPMHVPAAKAEAECKFWLHAERFEIEEEFEYNLTPRLRRILYEHFDEICEAWKQHARRRDAR